MKLVQTEHVVTRSEGTRTSGFSMAATSQAYAILSSGLYSDKPLAIVRELACNAKDAHVAAGKKDVPINIVLPTRFDATLIIEDFGTGLCDFDVRGGWQRDSGETMTFIYADEQRYTDEFMEANGWYKTTGVYNTYFKSTKTNSDEFIGQLGLGSKSPFSYANNFLVEVRHGITHNVYSCYKDQTRCPAIALLSSEEKDIDSPNGIKISIPIDANDCDKFVQAARQSLAYFDPHPNVTLGAQPYEIAFFDYPKDRSWNWRDANKSNARGLHVVQGFVRYPVDGNILSEAGLPMSCAAIVESDIDIMVDIGKVTSAASREALQYDDHTIDNLIEAIQRINSEVRADMLSEFDGIYKPYAVAMKHQKLFEGTDSKSQLYVSLHRSKPFEIEGIAVSSVVDVGWWHEADMDGFMYTHNSHRSAFRRHVVFEPKEDGEIVGSIAVNNNLKFLFVPKHRGAQGMIRRWATERSNAARVLVFQVRAGKDIDKCRQDIKDYCELYGFPYEELDLVKYAPVRTATNRLSADRDADVEFYAWNQFLVNRRSYRQEVRRVYSRQCWNLMTTEDVDPSDGMMYVPISNFAVVDSRIGCLLDKFINEARKLDAPIDDHIFGLTKVDVEKLKSRGVKLTLVYDVIHDFIKERVTHNDVTTPANSIADIKGVIDSSVVDTICKAAEVDKTLLDVETPTGHLVALYREAELVEQEKTRATVITLANRFGVDVTTHTALGEVQTVWNEVSSRYRLLRHLRWVDRADIAHYINMVNTIIKQEKEAC